MNTRISYGSKVHPKCKTSAFRNMVGKVTAIRTNKNAIGRTIYVDFPGHWAIPFPEGTLERLKSNISSS